MSFFQIYPHLNFATLFMFFSLLFQVRIFPKKNPNLVDEVHKFSRNTYSFLPFQRGIYIVNRQKRWEQLLKFYFYPYIWVCTWTVLSVPNVLLKKKFCETKRKLYAVVVTTLDHTMCTIFFPFVVFSTHCTVHIKNWDTPKKLFVKWLFVRHIQCQGTTRY